MWFIGKSRRRHRAHESARGPISKDLRRSAGRTIEWHIAVAVGKKVPPGDRLFLLYEVAARDAHHARVQRALKKYGHRPQQWFGTFGLVVVSHDDLAHIVGSPEWLSAHVAKDAKLGDDEGRCVVVRDLEQDPEVIVFDACGVRRRA